MKLGILAAGITPDELIGEHGSYADMIIQLLDKTNSDFSFDNNTKNLYSKDLLIKLTKRETLFLELLIKNKNTILSIENIKVNLWTGEDISDERLRTFVKRFRVKTSKTFIKNISGQGYSLPVDNGQ